MTNDDGLLVSEGLRAAGILVHAPPPLGTLWIPLSKGLMVLYGRNGAGKTRVLDAISCALRGVALAEGHVSLHLSPIDYLGGFDHSLIERFETVGSRWDVDFDLEDDREIDRSPSISQVENDGDEAEIDAALLAAIGRLRSYLNEAAEKVGFARGLCHSPRLALVAVGDAAHPMWKPCVSVVPTDVSQFASDCGADPVPWNVVGPLLDPGSAQLPASLVHLWSGEGWREESLPVLIAEVPFTTPQQFGDLRDDGLAAKDMIACLHANAQHGVDDQTLASLRQVIAEADETSLISWADADTVVASPLVEGRLNTLSLNATLALRELAGEASSVRAVLRHPNEWPSGKVVSWLGTDAYGNEIAIDSLGAGAERWARLAISLALENADWVHASIVMIDEPERALHSAAQRQAAEAVSKLIDKGDLGAVPVVGSIIATHSAAFLALPNARLLHVSRGTAGTVALDAIDPTLGVEGLTAALGISRADALLMARCFVFVEGEHDAAILRTLFGSQFAARHAHLRTMDGALNISAHINADFLLTYSDARIRVVLDRVGAAVTNEWNSALAAAAASDRNTARRHLERIGRQPGRESKWLYEAGLAALQKGHIDRIELVGLEQKDIINYLPVETIVPGATSWKLLADEFFSRKRNEQFKQWLRSSKGASFNAASLAEIAATISDLGDLPNVIKGL